MNRSRRLSYYIVYIEVQKPGNICLGIDLRYYEPSIIIDLENPIMRSFSHILPLYELSLRYFICCINGITL